MKLLRIIASMDPKTGGPAESIRQVHLELQSRGHDSQCLTLDDPAAAWLAQESMVVHAMGPGLGGYGYAPKFKSWLLQHARNYDAIIICGLWQYHSIAARNVLVELGIPYLVFTHGMLDPWFKRSYPLKHLKKSLYWPWGDYRVLRDAHAVLFTCEEEKLLARQSFRQYQATEVVVNFGTSTPPQEHESLRALFLEQFPTLRGKRLFTFLGRIHEKKGCDLLISSFARVAATDPTLQLVMIGPDQNNWVPLLQAQAKALGIAAQISWLGMLQGDVKWGALHASEVFVLPSHQENFGIAVAEALGCGLPVLISDKVNIWREILTDGAGLVGPDTEQGTVHCLRSWLAFPESKQQSMVKAASAAFAKRYTISAMVDSILDNVDAMLEMELGMETHP